MQLLDLTLPAPEQNLACDEALLEDCEKRQSGDVLRFWEPPDRFVVLGYSNKAATESNLDLCRQHHVPVLRRCSGGGTVLQGPGCLNYALVLRIDESGPFRGVTETNRHIMTRHQAALQPLVSGKIEIQGFTDLAIGGLKFSGNSQRRGKHFLLFHGTFLFRFNLSLAETYLPMPSRQPPYRQNRRHAEFLMNLDLSAHAIKQVIANTWGATGPLESVPQDRVAQLAREKYSTDEWNYKF